MFNSNITKEELYKIKRKLDKIFDIFETRESLYQAIANGAINGQSLEKEEQIVNALKANVGEVDEAVSELLTKVEELKRLTHLSKHIAKITPNDDTVKAVCRKPRLKKP